MLLLMVVISAACQPQAEEPLPTLAMLDTPTPVTPTATWTPTETLIPTSTDTPTATSTPTVTATPTNTPTATLTGTPLPPTATSTHTLTPLPSNTPVPSATDTPVASATASVPVINSFTSNIASAAPGTQVILTWSAEADSARIERLNSAGVIQETIPVPPVSSSTLTVPAGETRVVYRLVAVRAGQETSLSVAIAVSCSTSWFFSNASAALGCPSATATNVIGAYQPFQTGFMFRVQYNSLDKVCGYQQDRQRYSCSNYQPYAGTPPATPPSGFQAPGADLQSVYYNQLAIGGPWYSVIGWGTSSMTNPTITLQPDAQGQLYINLPNGIFRFDAALTSGTPTQIR
ncbi:hypothetical protein G4Y79_10210 [Phototrophicus methaneseepsis]|uniref:Uncharacterized protein n=1 Tax=Phototrophicus methaneseepsis TaxID=2710758 RepID=A0A7S8ED32_9CHLR|nr:hypothetical protein [Phototrophicus methaneseepsis]QPC84726.1 hypothetical protein G4Y79_10210 [Phototrophicus methaneseepsis]